MPRVIVGWLLIVHALAHTFAGSWSAGETTWAMTLPWFVASSCYFAAGLGLLRVPLLRHWWKELILVATCASIVMMVWYHPPGGMIGIIVDIALMLVSLGAVQRRADVDIEVAETTGASAMHHPWLTRTAWALGAAAFAYFVAVMSMRPVFLRWGSTPAERIAALPGDDVHPKQAGYRIDHAITIHARASAIWPWLLQMGQDRGGFYSYDWLERAVGADIRNADRLHDEWQARSVGDTIFATQRSYLGGRFGGLGWRVSVLEPNRVIGLENWGTFVLQPIDSATTRLIVRTRGPGDFSVAAFVFAPLNLFVFEPAHFIMERAMLRGIRERVEAESRGRQASSLGTSLRFANSTVPR
jgi:hypothetical protein